MALGSKSRVESQETAATYHISEGGNRPSEPRVGLQVPGYKKALELQMEEQAKSCLGTTGRKSVSTEPEDRPTKAMLRWT